MSLPAILNHLIRKGIRVASLVASMTIGVSQALAMPSLAILSPSPSNSANLAAGLNGTGQFSSITEISNTSSITAGDLAPFDVVFTFSNSPYANSTVVGDALKDYVDAGGSLVASTYAFSNGFSLAGGITQPGYLPFQIGATGFTPTFPIVALAPGDPIFAGIDLSTVLPFANLNFINPVLDPGASLLAVDQSGAGLIARNAAGNIIGLNLFPGFNEGGDFFPLLANAALSATNATPTSVPEPSMLALLGIGLAGLGLISRRRRNIAGRNMAANTSYSAAI